VAPHVLFLEVNATGDNATWPPERHSQETKPTILMHNGDDVRRQPFTERKAMLRKVLQRTRRGIQCVEHTEGDGGEMFKAICKLGLEGIVSKKARRAV
jgi:ATP dependent DNA ligase domain